jgi:uncharacterized protein (DUF427 family)
MKPRPLPAGPGQESVWDYPRPPALVPSGRLLRVVAGAGVLAETSAAFRVLETSHPPTWYLPPTAWADGVLRRSSARGTVCEYKGLATYWDVADGAGGWLPAAAWSYEEPTPAYAALRSHLSCYPGRLSCTVDGEQVRPQAGGFYGGWITDDVVGPFKGEPGTLGW